MKFIRHSIKKIRLLRSLIGRPYFALMSLRFRGSADYWHRRYKRGGNSGSGSYGRLAAYKAKILNDFVVRENIKSVIEFGCGDGSQLRLAVYPMYTGMDISADAISSCRRLFAADASKDFVLGYTVLGKYDLALSLDVVYHLVEDLVYHTYMASLFNASTRYVIIYSSNHETPALEPHIRHRCFTRWVQENAPEWQLKEMIFNDLPYSLSCPDETSFSDFYIFKPKAHQSASIRRAPADK